MIEVNTTNLSDFLGMLLSQNKVTFKNIYDCADAKYEELMSMERIFDLETEEHAQCCLTIPRLLDPLAADEIIAFFREENRNNPVMATDVPDTENYKVLLLSAFAYNTSFFAMAWNWCGFIRQELQLQMQQAHALEESFVSNLADQLGQLVDQIIKIFTVINKGQPLQYASGTESIQEIGDWRMYDEKVHYGNLWIQVAAGEARFIFRFETYYESPPYHIAVKCRTKDGKEYSDIILKEIYSNSPENRELIIKSDVIPDFDYSDVEILKVVGIKID